jgi:hypothetical protein
MYGLPKHTPNQTPHVKVSFSGERMHIRFLLTSADHSDSYGFDPLGTPVLEH